MVSDRSAVSTISGYFYQFDRSILSILELCGANDTVAIECIEDIDVHTATETTAVQCKYYEMGWLPSSPHGIAMCQNGRWKKRLRERTADEGYSDRH